jgi:hypothetical protein
MVRRSWFSWCACLALLVVAVTLFASPTRGGRVPVPIDPQYGGGLGPSGWGALTGATWGGGYSVQGTSAGGSGNSTSTSGSTSASSSGQPRDPAQWPFAQDSPWNYPIGSSAQYVGFHWRNNASLAGIPDSIGIDPNVSIIYIANSGDPLRNVTNRGWGNEVWTRRIPNSATTTGGENMMTIIDVDHLSSLDLYDARKGTDGSWSAGGLWNVDMKGQGWGLYTMCLNPPPADGNTCHGQTRASGVPTFAGVIRSGELKGGINHALAMIVGGNFLNKTPWGGGSAWPAVAADSGWETSYAGQTIDNVYMGSLFAIPLSVDINSLGLALPQSKNFAKALQQYGAYAVDRGDTGVMDIAVDHNAEWVAWYNDPNFGSDMKKIGAACRIVTNSYNSTKGGKPKNGVKLDGGDGTLSTKLAPSF